MTTYMYLLYFYLVAGIMVTYTIWYVMGPPTGHRKHDMLAYFLCIAIWPFYAILLGPTVLRLMLATHQIEEYERRKDKQCQK